jgi:hypothetical protein
MGQIRTSTRLWNWSKREGRTYQEDYLDSGRIADEETAKDPYKRIDGKRRPEAAREL